MSNLKLINMEDVEVEEVKWLIYPFIPYGKITIIQGDPGEGKTTLVLQIIARLTKGESIVNEEAKEPINVIYQTAEDGLADTIKPRLLSADADCSKVLVIDDKDTPLTMRDVIVQPNTRVYKALRNQMADILTELRRIENSANIDSDLLDKIQITVQTYNGLAEKEKS